MKGNRPGHMPSYQPTRLYLTLNSRTVGRMGIRLPQNLLARADHRSAFEQRTHLAVVLRPARRAAMNTDRARPGAAACYLSGIARAEMGDRLAPPLSQTATSGRPDLGRRAGEASALAHRCLVRADCPLRVVRPTKPRRSQGRCRVASGLDASRTGASSPPVLCFWKPLMLQR